MNDQMWQMIYQFMVGVQNSLDEIVRKLNDIEKEIEASRNE